MEVFMEWREERNYLLKLDFVPDEDIHGGGIPVQDLFSDERAVGITYASLDSLTSIDWHEWIVDRLLTGRNADFRPFYDARGGEDYYRYLFFSSLIMASRKIRKDAPTEETFIPKLIEGYRHTIPIFIDETIPLPQKREVWSQDYYCARDDLIVMGSMVFGNLIDRLNRFRVCPRDTEEEQKARLREIEQILQESSL